MRLSDTKGKMMKTLVRMKSTQMGKDDDSPLTLKYNEGCECRIGPDLLKAFQNLDAVEILKEKKQEPVETERKRTETKGPDDDFHSGSSSTNPPSKYSNPDKVEQPKKKRGPKKTVK